MSVPEQIIDHWPTPDTELSHVAPSSSLLVTVATPLVMALTDRLNQVRIADRFQTHGEPGTCLSWHMETFPVDWAGETTWIQWLQRWQSIVECSKIGQAPKRMRSSTAPRLVSSHLDPVLLLGSGRPGQESGVGEAQPTLTLIHVWHKS